MARRFVLGKISVAIQDRTYRLSCGDGEEVRLRELADYVRAKSDQLVAEHGRIGETHLLLMSAILIADELWDARGAEANEAAEAVSASDDGQAA